MTIIRHPEPRSWRHEDAVRRLMNKTTAPTNSRDAGAPIPISVVVLTCFDSSAPHTHPLVRSPAPLCGRSRLAHPLHPRMDHLPARARVRTAAQRVLLQYLRSATTA